MTPREGGGGSVPAIGIDLGTTYSCVGVWQHGKVEIIVNGQGNRTTPSYVAFSQEDMLVGDAAKNQIGRNPNNTVYDVKRLIGRKFSDPVVQNDIKLWPFKVITGDDDKPLITVQHKGQQKRFTAEDISSMVLGYMREIAEVFLATKVKNAVLTVPAYFSNAQREATKAAGTQAGLNVMRVINEPTAAAIAYGLSEKTDGGCGKKNVLIFDLGGGTFDVSLISIDGGDVRVIATAGDSHLGGLDFDTRLVNYCLGVFERKHKKDISGDTKAIRKLRTACEKAKRTLSRVVETTVEIDYLFGDVDFQCPISCAKFDDLNMNLFRKCMELVKQCLKDANMDKKDVDEVVLVGGSTRILKVQELLQEFFDGGKICKSINPDEAVACGAAIQAAILGGQESMRFEDLVLRDVTPLPLGIGIVGGLMSIIIPKNTPIPVRMTKIFTTSFDDQTVIDFSVYEGVRTVAQENNLLGKFRLSGIPQLPKLVPKIPVWFEIDENGILVVSAEDPISKVKVKITIRKNDDSTAVNESNTIVAEIEREITRKVEARVRLENYAHDLRKMMKNDASVLKHEGKDVEKMEAAVDNTLLWLTSNLNATTDDLNDKRSELEINWSLVITKVRVKDKKDVVPTSVDGQGQEQTPDKKKTHGFLACCGFGDKKKFLS